MVKNKTLTNSVFYVKIFVNDFLERGTEMPGLKLIKNPGYVYDLMFLFYYKFNADLIPEMFEATEEDMEYFSENAKLFDPISDDLYIFFRLVPSERCFFTVNYFNNFAKVFTTEYDLAFVQKQISDHDSFMRNVIKHYFEELDDVQVNECIESKKRLFEIIKKSEYDDKFKSKLYEFFIDPESYIRLLQYELMAKDIQLSSYYERNYSKILDVYNGLRYEALEEEFVFLGHNVGDKLNRDNLFISFCLLNKNLLYFSHQTHATLYLIGVDYLSSIEHLRKKHIDLIPDQFGAALSEVNRVKMLDLILEKGECTCKELGTALGIPASTAYHHVSTLERCGAVEATIVRKSMIYRINRKYFSSIIEYFKKFSESSER